MQTGDHFPNTCLGESLSSQGMTLLYAVESFLQLVQLLLRPLVLLGGGDHSRISTSPLRRPSGSRVRLKKSTHSSQSVSSSAAKISSGRRVNNISSNSTAGSYSRASCCVKSSGSRITASIS